MTKINRILAIALAVQIAIIALVHLRHDATAIGKMRPVLSDFDTTKVTRVRVFDKLGGDETDADKADKKDKDKKAAAGQPAIDIVKRNAGWVLASHFDFPVEQNKVSDLLDKLESMRSRGPMAHGNARARQLQVADDSYARKLVVTAGGKDLTLYIGASAGARETSVRVAGDDDIYGVSGLSTFAVPAEPTGWVDGDYVRIDVKQIASFDVVNDNASFSFEPDATGEWKVTANGQPITPPAGSEIDKTTIQKLLQKMTRVVMTEPADPKAKIDKPLATVTVRLKPADKPVETGATSNTSPPAPAAAQPQETTFVIGPSDRKDRYVVREEGNPTAVQVDALGVTDLVELTRDRLVRKQEAAKPESEGGGPPSPGEAPPPELTP